MTWFERINEAIEYIETNLSSDIEFKEIERIACYSISNFQKVFSVIADVSPSEYIRRRRLTLAALELQTSDAKIIDIALKYGYDSPEAFTRAFHNHHGIAPSSARENGVSLKAFPRISILLTIQGDAVMDYRIEEKDAFKVYGIEDCYTYDGIKNAQGRTIPEVWQDIMKDGRFGKLCESVDQNWLADSGFTTRIGKVFAYDSYKPINSTAFPYLIGCYMSAKSKPEGFTIVDVPAATWAIFSTIGNKTPDLQALKKRIYTEWLPTTNYKIIENHGVFEMYYTADNGEEGCELWYSVSVK